MIRARFQTSVLLLLFVATLAAQEPKPPELTPEEQTLAAKADKLQREARELHEKGQPAQALEKLYDVLEIRRKLYPESRYPNGHVDLGAGLNNLAVVLRDMGQPQKALPYCEQALAIDRRLYPESRYPKGHPALVACLNNVGYTLEVMDQAERALPYYEQCLAMLRKLDPESKDPYANDFLAGTLNNLGMVLYKMGQSENALRHLEQALTLKRKLYPASRYPGGHPAVARGLNNLGGLLEAMGQPEKALPYHEQALAMKLELYPPSRYPDGHPALATNLNNMGILLEHIGQTDKALPYYEQALAMDRKLYPPARYPDGHPEFANSLNNLGGALGAMRQYDKALGYFHQGLAMRRKLYPESRYADGHPDIAISLNNIGCLMHELGQLEQALSKHEEALAMRRKLYPESRYPNGHPTLASSFNNLGSTWRAMGQMETALTYHGQSLGMYRKIYAPARYVDGHPEVLTSLGNLAGILRETGHIDEAIPYCMEALTMQQKLLQRDLATASETAALDRIADDIAFHAYLNATRSGSVPAARVYEAIWPSRSMATRVLERRHADIRAAGTAAAEKLAQVRDHRRRTEQLLQDMRMEPNQRDKLLADLADRREKLEREIITAVPILKQWQERDALGPNDLQRALPPGTAFIDIISYVRLELDQPVKNKPTFKRTPSYAAFVLAPGRQVERIELGDAPPINDAVQNWRQAIEGRASSPAAEQLARLVWQPLAKSIGPGTKTLYLALDGDLARLPWAALPVGDNRVLLEDHTIAVLPHGPFLLEQLRFPQSIVGADSVLALGGLDYQGSWPALPGTANEVSRMSELAPTAPTRLTKTDASAARIRELLPKMRYAHLATHAEFKAREYAAECRRQSDARRDWQEGRSTRRTAVKNPLGFVGLVLSGGEVLTGLSLVDLPLENMRLVTLSACETGLGEFTGGEGVQGLQRAFHLAGCPNVVASLWKVDDAATAALMAKFYHELWTNKKPPIEALREAQLLVFRHPELIPELAGERGTEQVKKTVVAKPSEAGAKRTDTKLWAAFMLSGAGK